MMPETGNTCDLWLTRIILLHDALPATLATLEPSDGTLHRMAPPATEASSHIAFFISGEVFQQVDLFDLCLSCRDDFPSPSDTSRGLTKFQYASPSYRIPASATPQPACILIGSIRQLAETTPIRSRVSSRTSARMKYGACTLL